MNIGVGDTIVSNRNTDPIILELVVKTGKKKNKEIIQIQ